MNQKSDAKIRGFWTEYKYLGVFLARLLRQGGGFATKGRKGLRFCRKSSEWRDLSMRWNKLKQRLKEEGNETVTNCHQLKLRASDGKMCLTDVADTEQLFRLIQPCIG